VYKLRSDNFEEEEENNDDDDDDDDTREVLY